MQLGDAANLLALSAAVWRIAYMVVWENGPLFVFERAREFVGIRYAIDGERKIPDYYPSWRRSVCELFSCVYCMSMWVSFFFLAVYSWNRSLALKLSAPFALSAAAVTLDRLHDGKG